MKRIRHYFEYGFLIAMGFIIRLLPLSTVRYLARRLADLVYYFIPVRKKESIENLTQAFGDSKTKSEIRHIAKKTYEQFAQTFFELAYFPRLSKEDILKMVAFQNLHFLDEALKNNKGCILVGSHFGNWELMGIAVAARYPLTFVVGEQTNKMTDDLLNSYRRAKGVTVIPLKFALRGVMKALKKNEFVALVSDQDAHENGTFVDFFGRPASTPKAAAQFALRQGCPIITGHIIRMNGNFHIIFNQVPKPEIIGDLEKDIENYTSSYTKIIEDYCRRHPEHWFWMHRRWKTKKP
ncbi:MAG: lysophospholipid acyltransferase family protein [Elusimicrobia bacterium]|nr:lysophospholipid acyltransferase family protein [Candidatus Liberimonas magnetica]